MQGPWWSKIEFYIAGLLASIGLALVAYEMFVRIFVPRFAIDWGQEVTIFLVVWAMLLTGGVLVRDNAHIRADIVIRLLKPKQVGAAEIFNNAVGVAFCLAMTWLGYEVVRFAIDIGEQSDSTLQVPMAFYFASLPVGMGLMAWRFIIRLYRSIRDFGEDPEFGPRHEMPTSN